MTAKANKVGGLTRGRQPCMRVRRRVGVVTGASAPRTSCSGCCASPTVAQVLGCDLGAAREALDAMDRDALVAIGIDRPLDAPPVPTREPALGGRRAVLKAVLTDHLPMTPVAKRAMEEAGKDRRHGRGSAAPWDPSPRWSRERVLIALLSLAPPDPAAALLDALDVDRAAVGARLSEAIGGPKARDGR